MAGSYSAIFAEFHIMLYNSKYHHIL